LAISSNIIKRGAAGELFFRVVDVTLDNAYPAGGWAIAAKDLGFGVNGVVYGVSAQGDTGGFAVSYNPTTKKLMVRDASGAANALTPEITTATLMNGVVVRLLAWGIGQG
jgi:hypothetical protein